MPTLFKKILLLFLVSVFIFTPSETFAAPKKSKSVVKKMAISKKIRYLSSTDICYKPTDRSYSVIRNFKEFNTLADCENSRMSAYDKITNAIYSGGTCDGGEVMVLFGTANECYFIIKDPEVLKSNKLIIRAEIVAASRFGRSEPCKIEEKPLRNFGFDKDGIPINKIDERTYLLCKNVPTGTKERNAIYSNPSDVAIFVEGYDVGFLRGSVKLNYGGTGTSTESFGL